MLSVRPSAPPLLPPAFRALGQEEIDKWSPWWRHDLRHISVHDAECEIEYIVRTMAEAADDPLIADGYVPSADDYLSMLRVREWMLREELRRRARWEPTGPDREGRLRFVEFAQECRRRLDLEVFLVHKQGLPLKRVGAAYEGLCPFHTEKTASFVVHSPRWKCWGCGQHGDVFDYLMVANQANDLRHAVQIVADYLGLAMPERKPLVTPSQLVAAQPPMNTPRGISIPTL